MHLNEDAAQTPHVDGQVVGDAEKHLRRPVEPRLDVLVDLKDAKQRLDLEAPGVTKSTSPRARSP